MWNYKKKLVLSGDEGAGETTNSWSLDVTSIDKTTYDLSAKNPNKKEELALRQPNEIVEEMQRLDEESAEVLKSILELI